MTSKNLGLGWSLGPLLLFVAVFLGTGVYLQSQGVDYAFYQLPAPVAIIPAILLALILDRRYFPSTRLDSSLEALFAGMGNNKVITMCVIYLLAGAFSAVAKASGGVDAVVNLGLEIVPANFILAGLFVISALVATSMGTSMGTIGAIAPIAVGLTQTLGLEPSLVAGAIVGGAIFGDNLSFISDTTIASTKTQGAELKDKFFENLGFALPAALISLVLYVWLGSGSNTEAVTQSDYQPWLAVPYFLIILLAILGVNVFLVLLLGILFAAFSGALFGSYEIANLGQDVYAGFSSMQEIFILSMLIGGLSELMKRQGGLAFLIGHYNRLVHNVAGAASSKTNQAGIAGLAFIANLAIANNTVAIVVTGDTAKQLAEEGHISPKRSASLLDIFSCIAQGLVPYGAQALLVAASFGISPIDVVSQVWYCMILAVISVVVIYYRKGETPQS